MSEFKEIKKDQNLYKKAAKGGFWVFSIRVVTQVLSIVRYIVLMNILQVKDIGLLGIAFLTIETLNIFTNTGFGTALIQKKGCPKSYLNTAWTVGIIRAFILFAILYLGSPFFVNLKNLPAEESALTVSVIRVLGLSFFINSLSNIGIIYFRKDLHFRKQFILQTLPTLISIAITVILVVVYENVWSLVFGRLSANIFRCITSYAMHPYRPKLKFDMNKAKELWGFGKWVLGATIIGFILTQGDDLFVWIYLDSFFLGLYQAAYKFSNIPATEISHVISQVSFPAYSKLQDDIPRLRQAYLKILKLTACMSIPVSGMIFSLTPEFVTIFLKQKWQPIIPAMMILAVFGLLRSIKSGTVSIYYSVGKPMIVSRIGIIKVIILAILIVPLTMIWDIAGAASAILAVSALAIPLDLYFLNKLIQCKPRQVFSELSLPLFSTLVMIAIVFAMKNMLNYNIGIANFILIVVTAVISYTLTLTILDKLCNYGIILTLKELAGLRSK